MSDDRESLQNLVDASTPLMRCYLLVDCGGRSDEDRDPISYSVAVLLKRLRDEAISRGAKVEVGIIGFGDGAQWLARGSAPTIRGGLPALGRHHDLGAAVELLRPELATFPTEYEYCVGSHVVAFLRDRSTGAIVGITPSQTRYRRRPSLLVPHGVVCLDNTDHGASLHREIEEDLKEFARSINPLVSGDQSGEAPTLHAPGNVDEIVDRIDWLGTRWEDENELHRLNGRPTDEVPIARLGKRLDRATLDPSKRPASTPELANPGGVGGDSGLASSGRDDVEPQIRLVFDDGRFVLLNPTRPLYRSDLNDSAEELAEGHSPIAELSKHPEHDLWGLRNLGTAQWSATLADGTVQDVDPARTLLARTGTRIDFGDASAEITEPVTNRLLFYLLLDTSGYMAGDAVGQLNSAVRELLPGLRDAADENPAMAVEVRAMVFGHGARWLTPSPVPLNHFAWTDVAAGGPTNLGTALRALAADLDGARLPPASAPPFVALVLGGAPTDDWEAALDVLNRTPLAQQAVRVGVAVGQSADREVIRRFMASEIQPLEANNSADLLQYIRWIPDGVGRR